MKQLKLMKTLLVAVGLCVGTSASWGATTWKTYKSWDFVTSLTASELSSLLPSGYWSVDGTTATLETTISDATAVTENVSSRYFGIKLEGGSGSGRLQLTATGIRIGGNATIITVPNLTAGQRVTIVYSNSDAIQFNGAGLKNTTTTGSGPYTITGTVSSTGDLEILRNNNTTIYVRSILVEQEVDVNTAFTQDFTGDSTDPSDYEFTVTGTTTTSMSATVTDGKLTLVSGMYTNSRGYDAKAAFTSIPSGNEITMTCNWATGNATGNNNGDGSAGSYSALILSDGSNKAVDIRYCGKDQYLMVNGVKVKEDVAREGTYAVSVTLNTSTQKITALSIGSTYTASNEIDFYSSDCTSISTFQFSHWSRSGSWVNTSTVDDISITYSVCFLNYAALYQAEKAVYDTKVESLDASGQAYWTANVAAASSVTDASTYATAIAALPTTYVSAVKAQTTAGSDMTDAIINPGMEVDGAYTSMQMDVTGWNHCSTVTNYRPHTIDNFGENTSGAFTGTYAYENWRSTSDGGLKGQISQTVTGLPNGAYKFQLGTYVSTADGQFVYAKSGDNTYKTSLTTSANTEDNTVYAYVTDGSLEFGLDMNGSTNGWAAIDNARLTYMGSASSVSGTIASSGYSSLASAYNLDLENATGLTAAYVVSNITKDAVTLTSVTELPANQGVILKGTSGAEYSIPVKATAAAPAINKLKAAVTATAIEANEAYILQGGKFCLVTADSEVPAGKAYLLAEDVPTNAHELGFVFEDDATGINNVENTRQILSGDFYNLAGQRVAQPAKGLYIVNGRKVVVK